MKLGVDEDILEHNIKTPGEKHLERSSYGSN